MSKLEFFCSRPTVVALIGFGLDLSAATYVGNDKDANTKTVEKSDSEKEKNDESGRIEGLLGYGKDRVVFYLNMNVDSVTVFLNKEDSSQLAMFVQERFVLDIKVRNIFLVSYSTYLILFSSLLMLTLYSSTKRKPIYSQYYCNSDSQNLNLYFGPLA